MRIFKKSQLIEKGPIIQPEERILSSHIAGETRRDGLIERIYSALSWTSGIEEAAVTFFTFISMLLLIILFRKNNKRRQRQKSHHLLYLSASIWPLYPEVFHAKLHLPGILKNLTVFFAGFKFVVLEGLKFLSIIHTI